MPSISGPGKDDRGELDGSSEQADSAYADLVRMTGYDPETEILAKLRR